MNRCIVFTTTNKKKHQYVWCTLCLNFLNKKNFQYTTSKAIRVSHWKKTEKKRGTVNAFLTICICFSTTQSHLFLNCCCYFCYLAAMKTFNRVQQNSGSPFPFLGMVMVNVGFFPDIFLLKNSALKYIHRVNKGRYRAP